MKLIVCISVNFCFHITANVKRHRTLILFNSFNFYLSAVFGPSVRHSQWWLVSCTVTFQHVVSFEALKTKFVFFLLECLMVHVPMNV